MERFDPISIRIHNRPPGLIFTSGSANQTANLGQRQLTLLTVDELGAQTSKKWLVENVLHQGGIAVLYGASGSYKTFLALDLALSVSTGGVWHQCQTAKGRVLYITTEGTEGLYERVRAWAACCENPQVDGLKSLTDIHFMLESLNLHEKRSVDAFLATLRAQPERLSLIVIDTLARSMVGADENSQKDMMLVVSALDRIKHETGAAVLVVHHTGKQGDQERGSSALRSAADTMMLAQSRQMTMTLSCTKQKDAMAFKPLNWQLVPVGNSLVPRVSLTGAVARSVAKPSLTHRQQQIVDTLSKAPMKHSQIVGKLKLSKSTASATLKDLTQKGIISINAMDRTYFLLDEARVYVSSEVQPNKIELN